MKEDLFLTEDRLMRIMVVLFALIFLLGIALSINEALGSVFVPLFKLRFQ